MKIPQLTSLVFFLSISLNVFAQIGFEESIVVDNSFAANYARDVFAADIDNDGDMDVLSASSSDDKIAWYENIDGTGIYSPRRIITTDADNATSVFAIDIDGDGDIDVLSSSSYDDKIAWYENIDGNGTFGSQQVVTLDAESANSVYSSDIDGDGDMDVLSASSADNKIAWYENIDGLGTFGPQQVITVNAFFAKSVFTNDIDGDGDFDVLSASYGDNKIAWYQNTDGMGTFGSQQIITTNAEYATSVFSTDIDDDGDLDVLSASEGDDKIAWYENIDGLGTFSSQLVITIDAQNATSVYSSDIDNDGDIDVLSSSGEKIAWYENTDGEGTFSSQQIITTNAHGARSVHSCDIDGDGDLDVLSAFGEIIAWHDNADGTGAFGDPQVLTDIPHGLRTIHHSDIDNDGHMDILSASASDNKIAWYKNTDGMGTFSLQKIISTSADFAQSVYAVDIDNDGDMDVLSASYNDSKIAWYENLDGLGTFGSQQVITTEAVGAQCVYACDIDGDGDMDVLSASVLDYKIAWYENLDGQGTFGAQQVISLAIGAFDVFASDLDGDGDLDVLSASKDDDKIAWYENTDGEGTFGSQQIITTNANVVRSVHACDLDEDGDIDVLSASFVDDKIAWYENTDGSGTFSSEQIISNEADGAYSVFAIDIDGDGDNDVLSASANDNRIAWYENINSEGSFGPQQTISTSANFAYFVTASDINSDGNIDVLSSSVYDEKIAWYKNLGPLSVDERPLTIFNVYPVPTKDVLNIQPKGNISSIKIYSQFGQLVFAHSDKKEIDISTLNKGIYFLSIVNKKGDVYIIRIIKI